MSQLRRKTRCPLSIICILPLIMHSTATTPLVVLARSRRERGRLPKKCTSHSSSWPWPWPCLASKVDFDHFCSFLISSPPAVFVCKDGWTLSDEMCFKVVETALSFADASTACAGLATNGLLAAPKSEAILNTLNTLNQNGDDVWIGLDDRYATIQIILIRRQIYVSPGTQKGPTHSQMELHLSKLGALWEVTTSPGVTASLPGNPVSRMPMLQRQRQRTA